MFSFSYYVLLSLLHFVVVVVVVVVVTFKYQGISFASYNSCQDRLHLLSPILEVSFRFHCLNYLIFFRKMRILELMCFARDLVIRVSFAPLLYIYCLSMQRVMSINLAAVIFCQIHGI